MKYTMIVLVAIALTLLVSGCLSTPAMEYVIEAKDETIESEIQNSPLPLVILTHKDYSDPIITAAGPVLNQFARGLKDQCIFMNYPYKSNGKWMKKMNLRSYGSFHLFVNGKEVKSIVNAKMIPDRKVSITALLFSLIKDEIIPKDEATASNGATMITAKDFQSKVLDSPKTVIIAFNNIGPGRSISFNPNYNDLAKDLGGLADFYISDDAQLLEKCELTQSPSLCVFSNGEKVSEYTDQLYEGEGKEHLILYQLLPFMPYTDIIFMDEE